MNFAHMNNRILLTLVGVAGFIGSNLVGLAVCAKPLVIVLLTEKWIEAVFFLRVFCFTYVLWPIQKCSASSKFHCKFRREDNILRSCFFSNTYPSNTFVCICMSWLLHI